MKIYYGKAIYGKKEIDAVNKELQHLIVKAGGKKDKVVVSPNNTFLKVELEVKDKEYEVDFRVEHSLRAVLGFNAKIYTLGKYSSENPVDIMSVNSIMVHCDIIVGSRLNGVKHRLFTTSFQMRGLGIRLFPRTTHDGRHFTHDVLADGSKRERIESTW